MRQPDMHGGFPEAAFDAPGRVTAMAAGGCVGEGACGLALALVPEKRARLYATSRVTCPARGHRAAFAEATSALGHR